LERHYGISNIIVETAGGGGGGGGAGKESALLSMHTGILEGVEDAAGIRDRILKRVQQCRGAGLGSNDDREPGRDTEYSWSPQALELLRQIAESAKIASLKVRGH
jgi:hypothetical protein